MTISGEIDFLSPALTFNGTLNFRIYGTGTPNNGFPTPDFTTNYGSFSQNISIELQNQSNRKEKFELILKPNITLPSGSYFISFDTVALTNSGSGQIIRIGSGSCMQALPIWDNEIGKKTLGVLGVTEFGNFRDNRAGFLYNIKFKTGQHYCTRIPVELDIATEITQQPVGGTTCEGSPISLSAKTNGVLTNQKWFYNNTFLKSINGSNSLSLSGNKSEAGKYHVVLTDNCGEHTSEKATIAIQDTIKITTQPKGKHCVKTQTEVYQ